MSVPRFNVEYCDRLADDFDRQLRRVPALRIEEFLKEHRIDLVEEMLAALLPVEMELCGRRVGPPKKEEYRQRFPQYLELVGEVYADWERKFGNKPESTLVPASSPRVATTCVHSPESAVASIAASSRLTLMLTSGLVAGSRFSLSIGATAVAGRSKTAPIFVGDDREASREHCRFEMTANGAFVEDLGSRNGTLLNGRIIGRASLQDGDMIAVGLSTLTVRYAYQGEIDQHETLPGSVANSGVPLPAIPYSTIGAYELTGVLGQGGMGVVYSATHRKTKELVAIKLVQPHMNATPQALQVFLREASILTGLKHPRIVASREFGVHEGRPYFVMEHVPAVDLEEILATQSPKRRVRVVSKTICKVLEALNFAHLQGIVHRDIKPSNILVFWTGSKLNCKLADFGLAKRFADAGLSGLTGENEIRGTLAYMPPEQLRDSRYAGPPADIYATGVCLYRYLAGTLPYRFTEGEALMRCVIQHNVRPLIEFVPDCPNVLLQIVETAMNGDPNDRFCSAGAMLEALADFVRQGA